MTAPVIASSAYAPTSVQPCFLMKARIFSFCTAIDTRSCLSVE